MDPKSTATCKKLVPLKTLICGMNSKIVKVFLRFAIASAFLSAVADRFGLWKKEVSVWGNWQSFVDYTALITPWVPINYTSALAVAATVAEVLLALGLMIGYRTKWVAIASGILLLMFAFAMSFSVGVKAAFDYSVFTASAAAFALSAMKERYLEIG
jgi:thiosulfate dehydrogenase (quinone) large subunit